MDVKGYERALRIVSRSLGGLRVKWWLCFGNVLHLIRDKSIDDDHDIDIGIHHGATDLDSISATFAKFQYSVRKKIISDVDKSLLYVSFESRKGLPPIDVFAWYEHNGVSYHTYDVNFENKKIPSVYCFKGTPTKLLPDKFTPVCSDKNLLRFQYQRHPKEMPLFREYIQIPLKYGSLMDLWYPDWMQKRKGQSVSPYVVRVKSMKQWEDKKHIANCLDKSQKEHELWVGQ